MPNCKYCGIDMTWRKVKGKWRPFVGKERHVCEEYIKILKADREVDRLVERETKLEKFGPLTPPMTEEDAEWFGSGMDWDDWREARQA